MSFSCPINTRHTYPRHDMPLVNPPPRTSWMIDVISHMSKWLVQACCSGPNSVVLGCPAGRWKEMQDEPFVWLIGRIKTALSFCSEAKTSQPSSHCDVRHPHGARSATERELAQPERGLASLSVLSQYELHSLWYPSADVALVSSCHKNFKCPSGMWQKVTFELYVIALVELMWKHLAWHSERSNKPNIQRCMSGKLLLLPDVSTC